MNDHKIIECLEQLHHAGVAIYVGCKGKCGNAKTHLECAERALSALRADADNNPKWHNKKRSDEQVIQERDDAEEALSQAYYLVTGRSPEWSNHFGHKEALEEIDEAQRLLRDAAKRADAKPQGEGEDAAIEESRKRLALSHEWTENDVRYAYRSGFEAGKASKECIHTRRSHDVSDFYEEPEPSPPPLTPLPPNDWTNHAGHTQPAPGCHLCKQPLLTPESYRAERLIVECKRVCPHCRMTTNPEEDWSDVMDNERCAEARFRISELDDRWQKEKPSSSQGEIGLPYSHPSYEAGRLNGETVGYHKGIAAGRKMMLDELRKLPPLKMANGCIMPNFSTIRDAIVNALLGAPDQ